MSTPTEIFRLGLLALLTGMAVPLLVQLFIVLRNVQRITSVLDRRLERTLGDLEAVAATVQRSSATAPSWPAALAATIPAVIAAVHAFRSSIAHPAETAVAATSSHNHTQENQS